MQVPTIDDWFSPVATPTTAPNFEDVPPPVPPGPYSTSKRYYVDPYANRRTQILGEKI